jgi:hypothetical protein
MTSAQQVEAPVVRTVTVRRSQEHAFRIFTERIGDWWPLQQYGIYEAEAAGVFFADGVVVERSPSGEESVWAEVTGWDPPRRLVLAWHPAGTADQATTVAVEFSAVAADRTRVDLVHDGWEWLGEQAASARVGYAGGWAGVIAAFAELVDGAA